MLKLFRKTKKLPIDREYFLSLLGGSEGGLATTTAIIVGLSLSESSRSVVVTSALVAFCVQAFNGSVGHFSAEHTNDEIEDTDERDGYKKPAKDALFYFVSHIIMSLVVLTPIISMEDQTQAIFISIGLTVLLLFMLGWYKGRVLENSRFIDGIEMALFGLLVIGVGAFAGLIVG